MTILEDRHVATKVYNQTMSIYRTLLRGIVNLNIKSDRFKSEE